MIAFALASCGCAGDGDGASNPTPTPLAPTATITATETVPASATPTATATAVPTDTATPTATPDESALAKYAEKGPYPVGVTTLNLGDRDIEVWYPLDPGSEAGAEKDSYASFDVLPDAIEDILPEHLNIIVGMDAYRDLPVSGDGPFPIFTFSHGAAGFRQAYSGFLTGIASHGFIVASLDHLEWGLLAELLMVPPAGGSRDPGEVVLATIERLSEASNDPSSPLAGGVDATRVSTSGHSRGGRAAFALPNRPEIVSMIGYATGTAGGVITEKPILLLVGAEDEGAGALEDAYDDITPVKRFVSIDHAGHNSFTDQCAIIHGGNNFLIDLVEAGFPIPENYLDLALDGCRPENLPPAEFWKVAQHFTVAHMRAALGLNHPAVGLGDGIEDAFGDVTLSYRRDDGSVGSGADVMGFVFSGFSSVVPAHEVVACPGGFNLGPVERQTAGLPPLPDDCNDPQANEDPDFRVLAAPGMVDGIDLDGIVSTKESPAECMHDDFVGPAGEPGFDLQVWRAVGCVRGFQAGEIATIVVDQAVRDGSMTILVEARGVDDWQEDDSVRVQVFASTDSPPVGGDGSVLPYGTLSAHEDGRYRSEVGAGFIEDGVLLAGPMDVRVRLNIQIVAGDLTFRDAWVRLELQPDGSAHGQIFGFQPVDEFYDIFGRQAGQAGASALGYTCSGLYAALSSQADGDFDADAGVCTSISVGYRFEAVPAFIVR